MTNRNVAATNCGTLAIKYDTHIHRQRYSHSLGNKDTWTRADQKKYRKSLLNDTRKSFFFVFLVSIDKQTVVVFVTNYFYFQKFVSLNEKKNETKQNKTKMFLNVMPRAA